MTKALIQIIIIECKCSALVKTAAAAVVLVVINAHSTVSWQKKINFSDQTIILKG